LIISQLRKGSQKGQTLVIFAMVFVILVGFAGLSIDGSQDYLTHRHAQNASDAGALAAATVFSHIAATLSSPPAGQADAAVKAAHDIVAANGFPTTYPTTCEGTTTTTPNPFFPSGSLQVYTATWFDTPTTPPGGCNATSGYQTKVTLRVPPSNPPPGACQDSISQKNPTYSCVQVDVEQHITHYLMGALGIPFATASGSAAVYAKQVVPGQAFSKVPPVAVYLYEPYGKAGSVTCATGNQCFDGTKPPSKSQLSCVNCPTLWTRPGTNPTFNGIDGVNALSPSADQLALFSNGDMLLQANTKICDTYNANVACTSNPARLGYTVTPGSTLYCHTQVGSTVVGPVCSGSPNTTLMGDETGPIPTFNWTPAPTLPTNNCGGLVLNGEAITSASFVGGITDASCIPPAADQYTILPGVYTFIVINHGSYVFERGLYDITSTAKVTAATLNPAGQFASDGIDHSAETTAADFDLCNTGTPNGCPTLTAGVWIGQGNLASHPASAGNSSTCSPGQPQSGTQGGGGPNTVITGSGVSFRFESTSAGFVSTNEVTAIDIDGPSPGSMPAIGGAPLLFDMESPTATTHLDSHGTTTINGTLVASGFAGLIFQTQSATAGGVELNPALSGTTDPAVSGQIDAYSLTTFGGTGTGVDFSSGYGTAGSVIVPTARNEPQIITPGLGGNLGNTPQYTLTASGNTETLTINYADEFALDAYDSYFKINGGNPIFFSKPLWNPPPNPGDPLPPNGIGNPPDDNRPAIPSTSNVGQPGGNSSTGTYTAFTAKKTAAQVGQSSDWVFSGTDPSLATTVDNLGHYTFEVNGFWTWGHETVIPGNTRIADTGNKTAQVFTFPKQPGATIQVQGYVTDGDRCGDFATFDLTLTQPGGPGGGSLQVPGGVQIMQ
jgi:Flp pilus assembly protein TadG